MPAVVVWRPPRPHAPPPVLRSMHSSSVASVARVSHVRRSSTFYLPILLPLAAAKPQPVHQCASRAAAASSGSATSLTKGVWREDVW